MNYLHYQVKAGPNRIVQVRLDKQAWVRFMDSLNYQKYVMRKPYKHLGGLCTRSPMEFRPPREDRWHVVVDLDGAAGEVKASVELIE